MRTPTPKRIQTLKTEALRTAWAQPHCSALRAHSSLLTPGKPLPMSQIRPTSTSASVASQVPPARSSHTPRRRLCLTGYVQMLRAHPRLWWRNVRGVGDAFGKKDSARPLVKSPCWYILNEKLNRVKTSRVTPSVFINNIKFPAAGVSLCLNKHSFLSRLLKDCATVVYYFYLCWSRFNGAGTHIQNQQFASHNLIPTRLMRHLRCVFFQDTGAGMAESARNAWKNSLSASETYRSRFCGARETFGNFFSWWTAN